MIRRLGYYGKRHCLRPRTHHYQFYHTLLDWREPGYRTDFHAYLTYLRASVERLCTNYGEIGGIWFDGKWDKPDADWQEDVLYATIRRHQPEAIIINNTGLHERGKLGHIELDSVTFERGRPWPINLADSPKYIASEMCQTMGDTWGYGAGDLNYKAPAELIEDLCVCRRCGANMLLNVGLRGDGTLRPMDVELLRCMGRWTQIYRDAAYLPRPTDMVVADKPRDFVLQYGNDYYLFCHGLCMAGDGNAVIGGAHAPSRLSFALPVRRVSWLDNGQDVSFEQCGDQLTVHVRPFPYGTNLVVRVAKIEA